VVEATDGTIDYTDISGKMYMFGKPLRLSFASISSPVMSLSSLHSSNGFDYNCSLLPLFT
jgi:hypothetical protein